MVQRNKILTDRSKKVIDFIEQTFWETGGMPTYDLVASKTREKAQYVQSVVEKNPTARQALIARGVDLTPDTSSQQLTSEQLMAANIMLNVDDKRSRREKLQFLGITSQKWGAWMRQPAFSSYMTRRAEQAFSANDWAAYSGLGNLVEEEDLNAIKLHFEMRGKYKNTLDVNINIESVMIQVIEVIAKHVKEPEIIEAIAEDISSLVSGVPVGNTPAEASQAMVGNLPVSQGFGI